MAKLTRAYSPSSSVHRACGKIERALSLMGVAGSVVPHSGAVLAGLGIACQGEVIEIRTPAGDLPPSPVRHYVRGMTPARALVWWRQSGSRPTVPEQSSSTP